MHVHVSELCIVPYICHTYVTIHSTYYTYTYVLCTYTYICTTSICKSMYVYTYTRAIYTHARMHTQYTYIVCMPIFDIMQLNKVQQIRTSFLIQHIFLSVYYFLYPILCISFEHLLAPLKEHYGGDAHYICLCHMHSMLHVV